MKLNIIRKSLLALVLAILTITNANSQVVEPGNITPLSPQVWSFMKYGNTSIDLNTGTVFESVPIYTYKDQDFEIPISVNYASNGYAPNIQTGILGLGWSLNAGGCITREVRGMVDEATAGNSVFGYYHYHKDISTHSYTWNDICQYNCTSSKNSNPHSVIAFRPINNNTYEVYPDIFTFNFGKHRGSFILGPAGQVYVYNKSIPTCNYKIRARIESGGSRGNKLVFDITTSDGYKYTFGWGGSMIDISNSSGYGSDVIIHNEHNLTFLLKTIKTPNGRTAEYNYSVGNISSSIKNHTFKPVHYSKTTGFSRYSSGPSYPTSGNDNKVTNIIGFAVCIQNTVNLESVIIDNAINIEFKYKEKVPEISVRAQELKNSKILDCITVYNSKTLAPLESCKFDYYVNQKHNCLTFLKSININNDKKFSFDYLNSNESFPKHGTCSIDHWGYYNGQYTITDQNDINGRNIHNLRESACRIPNATYSRMGMLEKITYPTGGHTKLEYEGNNYSAMVRNQSSDGNLKLSENITGVAGGVRVKSISNYDVDNTLLTSKQYTYRLPSSTTSSGILLFMPSYESYQSISFPPNSGIDISALKITSGNDTYGTQLGKYFIEYQYVRETNYDGSYTDYKYSSYRDTPDDTFCYFKSNIAFGTQQCTLDKINHYNSFRKPISYQNSRKKLNEVKKYNASNKLVGSISYTYKQLADEKFSETLESAYGFLYLHKTLVSDSYLSKEHNVLFIGANNADSIVMQTFYEYNFRSQLIKTATIDRNNNGLISNNVYVDPTASPADEIELFMLENNMVDYPFMTYTIDSATKAVVAGKSHEYIITRNSSPMLKIGRINNLSKECQIKPDFSSFETEVTFDKYDSKGNLLQSTTKDGLITSYIWGHNGLYLVAEVKNTTILIINNLVEFNGITSSPLANNINPTQITKLRSIPNTLVTIYSYKPFVGVTSVTNPAGITTYYDYDSKNKLKEVYLMKNGSKQLIESYNYDYFTNSLLNPII